MRRVRQARIADTAGMRRAAVLMIVALGAVGAFVVPMRAVAGAARPVVSIGYGSATGARLSWTYAGPPVDRWYVRLRTVPADASGTPQEDELADLDARDEPWLDLQPWLPGVKAGRCYEATFLVYPLLVGQTSAGAPGELTREFCADADGAVRFAFAPAPEPPLGVTLRFTADGAAQLAWDDTGPPPDRHGVDVLIVPVDGLEAGAEYDLGVFAPAVTTFVLPNELPGVLPGRCYQARFFVTAQYDDGRTPERSGSVGQAVCGRAASAPAAHDERSEYIGAPLHDPLPAPPPASAVRIERDGNGGYRLAWRYDAADPGRFDQGIQIVNPNGEFVAPMVLPSVPGNARSVALPRALSTPVAAGCYGAIARIFAVAIDGAVTLPANTATAICFDAGGRISFPDIGVALPDTGAGPSGGVHIRAARSLATVVSAAGAILMIAGAFGRRLRTHDDRRA
jgi:hypothetical protein